MTDDPVGIVEIAELLAFPVRTVHQWQFRELLPEADYASINGSKAWRLSTIVRWAGETGRLERASAELKAFHTTLTTPRRRRPRNTAATLAAP